MILRTTSFRPLLALGSVLLLAPIHALARAQVVSAPAGSRSATPAPRPSLPDCADGITDQSGGGCLQASSEPVPGLLFPPPHDGGVDNVSTGPDSFVGGGVSNTASGHLATVSGGIQNSAYNCYDTVSGGCQNFASGYAFGGATVSGGLWNVSSGYASSVVGGRNNVASGWWSTVGGGDENEAAGDASVVAGGYFNRASGGAAAIGGGGANEAGNLASVGGGRGNAALGHASAVPGGRDNLASGSYGLAAGRRARAVHDGAFVWGDGVDADKSSSRDDEFSVYASGGARIFSDAAATTGVELAPGSGSWSSLSDRAAKEAIQAVDPLDVLVRLRRVPISTWSYRAQGPDVRHMGPMADEFRKAFHLGASDTRIDTVDPDGVALAAIQGLAIVVEELRDELAAKDDRIVELRRRVEDLERDAAQDWRARTGGGGAVAAPEGGDQAVGLRSRPPRPSALTASVSAGTTSNASPTIP